MNSVTNYVLIALGVEKRLTNAFVIGVAFNVITNLIFLPRFSYIAASVTTILSEIILLGLFAYYLRPKMPDVRWMKLLVRPLAVTALMLWVMVIGSQIHLVVGLVAGLVAYPVGLLLWRVFGEEEKQILSSLLPERVMVRINPFL
jgi:O-antigen/teichoic acid export membrane protein